jgi:hypothetical protein
MAAYIDPSSIQFTLESDCQLLAHDSVEFILTEV